MRTADGTIPVSADGRVRSFLGREGTDELRAVEYDGADGQADRPERKDARKSATTMVATVMASLRVMIAGGS